MKKILLLDKTFITGTLAQPFQDKFNGHAILSSPIEYANPTPGIAQVLKALERNKFDLIIIGSNLGKVLEHIQYIPNTFWPKIIVTFGGSKKLKEQWMSDLDKIGIRYLNRVDLLGRPLDQLF